MKLNGDRVRSLQVDQSLGIVSREGFSGLQQLLDVHFKPIVLVNALSDVCRESVGLLDSKLGEDGIQIFACFVLDWRKF